MAEKIKTDLCVLGAGSGGLSLVAGAAQMGIDVVLIEGHKMGGDCLNYGCVPSKALLAAAARGQDYATSLAHVKKTIADIAPMDSVERFTKLGARVIEAPARFIDSHVVAAGEQHIRARRFVIATGSTAHIPPIAGLEMVPYLTNETLFDLTATPTHLIIIGGGPIGVEMAQAHIRLGCRVSLFEAGRLLLREDKEMIVPLRAQFVAEGVELYEHAMITEAFVAKTEGGRSSVGLRYRTAEGVEATVEGSHILVATGRKPNIDALDLAVAGVKTNVQGIVTNTRLQTNRRHIYAIGDVRGGAQFTHAAGYHAGIVLRNIVFHLPAKIASEHNMPRVVYTDPELAHVGMNEAMAQDAFGARARVMQWSFEENDRARAEADIRGGIKLILGPRARIVGVSIVGRGAGDLLTPWILAIEQKLPLSAMAGMIVPYPTRSEAGKRVAGAYYTPSLFGARMKRIVRILGWFRF